MLIVLCGSLLLSQTTAAAAADTAGTAEYSENYEGEHPEDYLYNLGGLVFSVPWYYELVSYGNFDEKCRQAKPDFPTLSLSGGKGIQLKYEKRNLPEPCTQCARLRFQVIFISAGRKAPADCDRN